jgi:hypothetical protein
MVSTEENWSATAAATSVAASTAAGAASAACANRALKVIIVLLGFEMLLLTRLLSGYHHRYNNRINRAKEKNRLLPRFLRGNRRKKEKKYENVIYTRQNCDKFVVLFENPHHCSLNALRNS